MIEHGPARESEVVLAFLKAEVDASRYGETVRGLLQGIGATREQLIDNADAGHALQNVLRRWLLTAYRGFETRQFLFLGFPTDVYWRRVELEPHELGRLKYPREVNWIRFSEETRRPSRLCERLARGELADDPGERVKAIQEKLKRGERFPELVAADGQNGDLILFEGCSRATAYVGLNWPEKIPMFLASSQFMHGWHFY